MYPINAPNKMKIPKPPIPGLNTGFGQGLPKIPGLSSMPQGSIYNKPNIAAQFKQAELKRQTAMPQAGTGSVHSDIPYWHPSGGDILPEYVSNPPAEWTGRFDPILGAWEDKPPDYDYWRSMGSLINQGPPAGYQQQTAGVSGPEAGYGLPPWRGTAMKEAFNRIQGEYRRASQLEPENYEDWQRDFLDKLWRSSMLNFPAQGFGGPTAGNMKLLLGGQMKQTGYPVPPGRHDIWGPSAPPPWGSGAGGGGAGTRKGYL